MALQAQVVGKLAAKRDPLVEDEVLNWCSAVTGEPVQSGLYEDVLKDGVILCKVMNKLIPGSINKINTSGGNFKLMENINAVQKAMKKYGVPEEDVFQTVDLFEKRNIPQVTQAIMALGRTCYLHPEWKGPFLGPKPSEEQKREFTEEQLRSSNAYISLQSGFNYGASQAGMNIGNTRHM